MDIFIVIIFLGGTALALGLGVFSGVGKLPKELPPGYEIHTYDGHPNRKYESLVWVYVTFHGVKVAPPHSAGAYGLRDAVKRARQDAFAHFRFNVDRKNP